MNGAATAPRTIAHYVKDVVRRLRRPEYVRLDALQEVWAQAVGPTAAQSSRVRGVADGILRVAVRSPALRSELEGFRRRELLGIMNRALPELAIREIRFWLE